MGAFGIERDPTEDDERMADLIMAAAGSWSSGYTRRAERMINEIVDESRGEYGRGVLARTVASILRERAGLAWDSGWQPADLDRYVARKLTRPERALLGDAMAHHVAQYAATTVHPDWWDQLTGLDARVWWPSHQHFLQARGERQDWRKLVTSSVRLIATVWLLPPIEKLGPAPGEAAARRGGADRSEVEPRILERVRRLLAKAESTTYAAEAETFTAGAQSLMARHSIDAALLAASGPDPAADGPAAQRLGLESPYESQKTLLLNKVADANRCRSVWAPDLGCVTLIGHRADRMAVETLFTSLLVQATSAMTQQGSRSDRRGRSRTTAFRRSFLAAFATRIGQRLEEATETEVRTVADEWGAGRPGGGQELAPLLERRLAAVDAAVAEMFPSLTTRQGPSATDPEGWDAGTAAADRASLAGAKEVDGGAG